MDTKHALYAAVGAPIAAAKALNSRLEALRKEVGTRTGEFSGLAEKLVEEWAAEGRQVVEKVSDAKMMDEITAKVDFDQAREQVSRLRDQLEEMLATWRTSFRPVEEAAMSAARAAADKVEMAGDRVEAATDEVGKTVRAKAERTAARAPAAKKPAAKKPAAKKPAPKKPAARKPAQKAS